MVSRNREKRVIYLPCMFTMAGEIIRLRYNNSETERGLYSRPWYSQLSYQVYWREKNIHTARKLLPGTLVSNNIVNTVVFSPQKLRSKRGAVCPVGRFLHDSTPPGTKTRKNDFSRETPPNLSSFWSRRHRWEGVGQRVLARRTGGVGCASFLGW